MTIYNAFPSINCQLETPKIYQKYGFKAGNEESPPMRGWGVSIELRRGEDDRLFLLLI
ncbi:MAG TPA: hypothetical protein V6D28_12595 [Leptolyngbyaceae cyanobacterium]